MLLVVLGWFSIGIAQEDHVVSAFLIAVVGSCAINSRHKGVTSSQSNPVGI